MIIRFPITVHDSTVDMSVLFDPSNHDQHQKKHSTCEPIEVYVFPLDNTTVTAVVSQMNKINPLVNNIPIIIALCVM